MSFGPTTGGAVARPIRGVLHVIHGHGGGTEHHARALIDASRTRYRHHLAIAVGDRWQLEAHQDDGSVRSFDLTRGKGQRRSKTVHRGDGVADLPAPVPRSRATSPHT